MKACAIVLAAGESRRMGEQKALLPWAGTTLLDYQLGQLSLNAEIGTVIVVTGHAPEGPARIAERYPNAVVAHNPDYPSGKVSSILAGLRAVPPDASAILLLAVDQPRPATVHQTLFGALAERDALIALPVQGGHRGHPVVFAASLLEELGQIDESTQGIRAVIDRHAADVLEVAFDDAIVHLDMNTPADLPGGA